MLKSFFRSITLSVCITSMLLITGCSKPSHENESAETGEAETAKTVTRVPDLVGLSHEEAQDLLYEADLAEEDIYSFNESVESGVVFETNPVAGSVVNKGTSILLNISKGPEPTPAPTYEPTPEPTPEPKKTVFTIPTGLIGLPINDAIKTLEEMGIEVRTSNKDISSFNQEQIDKLVFGVVAEVVPGEGSEYIQLDDGSTYVILYYY